MIKSQRQRFPTLETTRDRLFRLWMIGSGICALILAVEAIAGRFGPDAGEVIGWYMPNVLPTLSLMAALIRGEATGRAEDHQPVKPLFASFAVWGSAAYLGTILATILVEPFTDYQPLELLKLSNLWLGPLQGLVVSSIGVLFLSNRGKDQIQEQPRQSPE
jgi:hypothetical protein